MSNTEAWSCRIEVAYFADSKFREREGSYPKHDGSGDGKLSDVFYFEAAKAACQEEASKLAESPETLEYFQDKLAKSNGGGVITDTPSVVEDSIQPSESSPEE